MRTSSGARQLVTYPTFVTLLIAGVLLVTSVAPLYAEPAAMQPVNWFAPARASAVTLRTGFLLPTLAAATSEQGPNLTVTQSAIRGLLPTRLSRERGQNESQGAKSKSWWGRNWWWIVIPAATVAVWVTWVYVDCARNSC